MNSEIIAQLKAVKKSFYELENLNSETRTQVLKDLATRVRAASEQLIIENKKDLDLMDSNDPKYDRLLLNQERIQSIARDIELVATLPNPIGKILVENKMPNGLIIKKMTVPIGVIAVIYESRPNVTLDVFSLCFKTGNACVLKGSKEAFFSNQFLVTIIKNTLNDYKLNPNLVYLLPPEREYTLYLLKAREYIDLCIPRGSQALIEFVRKNAQVPIIETGAGIVHTYFDKKGDLNKGQLIINNAKTRRVSVCNALDTLVIHQKRLADLPELIKLLANKEVKIYADSLSFHALEKHYPSNLLHQAEAQNFGQEYLDFKMAIKTVSTLEEAIEHIQLYTSHHSEAIITEDTEACHKFLSAVDAAVVYVNASTAFTDGGQFGLGAEIGISTQKIHARGPMGLDALMSYKWIVLGDGQIRD
ncbi:proA gamma-glutamyl phosphate reductase [Legionella beliardensis]|uniref:Gamma-glutamyl phosphate reductase n=1 Tax=Legionella beliardensis TaxID=91822 RepID=A0A378I171_9GAMM|nr:glutamate-5-semialdehyde dehydrogenase [Legionella beliardensis]STX28899.1 proA gamma-glutamyl phosphate reductase [Legionella beliardensis]